MDIRLAALFAQFSAPSGGCDALPVLGSPPLAFIMPLTTEGCHVAAGTLICRR
jgi:hypothetical protein